MSRALQRVGAQHRHAIDALAHMAVAIDLANKVEGFDGFAEHYRDHGMTPHQRRLWRAFLDRIPEIHKDMARMLEQTEWDRDGGGD